VKERGIGVSAEGGKSSDRRRGARRRSCQRRGVHFGRFARRKPTEQEHARRRNRVQAIMEPKRRREKPADASLALRAYVFFFADRILASAWSRPSASAT